ncbi:MAG TPA: hypothetical protein VNS79_11920 [Sphingobium sp.]|nr:hypothetical protein [Sphingobium sp.]
MSWQGRDSEPREKADHERAKKRKGWKTFEVACGHDIMIDAPNELAAILVSASKTLRSASLALSASGVGGWRASSPKG